MTIEIVSSNTFYDLFSGEALGRGADIIIVDGSSRYLWAVGGLPLEGDLQALLDPREAEFLAAALAAGVEPNAPENEEPQALAGARGWFDQNPNSKLLFSLSIPDLQNEIYTLVDALFPTATAGNRNRLKLLLMALSVTVRVLVKRQKLD